MKTALKLPFLLGLEIRKFIIYVNLEFSLLFSSHNALFLISSDDGDEIVLDIYHDKKFGSFVFDIVGVS